MKRFVTLATVLLVGLASVQLAHAEDQSKKKKKKKAQTTQAATPAPKKSATQTSNQSVSSQTSKRHVSSQTSSNQQATNRYYKKGYSNAGAAANYNQRNTQVVQTKKSKNKNQNYVVTNNNAQWNKKAWKHYKPTGNEWSFSAAQQLPPRPLRWRLLVLE